MSRLARNCARVSFAVSLLVVFAVIACLSVTHYVTHPVKHMPATDSPADTLQPPFAFTIIDDSRAIPPDAFGLATIYIATSTNVASNATDAQMRHLYRFLLSTDWRLSSPNVQRISIDCFPDTGHMITWGRVTADLTGADSSPRVRLFRDFLNENNPLTTNTSDRP